MNVNLWLLSKRIECNPHWWNCV